MKIIVVNVSTMKIYSSATPSDAVAALTNTIMPLPQTDSLDSPLANVQVTCAKIKQEEISYLFLWQIQIVIHIQQEMTAAEPDNATKGTISHGILRHCQPTKSFD